jgi:DNA-binding NarL/FixJ family response regulator
MERTAVVVDPEGAWARSLEALAREAGFDVVGQGTRPEDAVELVDRHDPELLVCDLTVLERLGQIRETKPDLRVVMVSNSRNPSDIDQALRGGVDVYVFKTSHPEDIACAMRQAFEVTFVIGSKHAAEADHGADVAASRIRNAGLTRRELEMLTYISDGSSNREIARRLWVTEQTVKFHLSNIYRKLDVANRTEASRWAQLNGLLSAERRSANATAAA